jgi:Type II secretion system protein C
MVSLTVRTLFDSGINLLEFALLALLAASLAYWTWAAITPRATAATDWPAQPSVQDRGLLKRDLFGAALEGGTGTAGRASAGLTLLGVFSGAAPGKGRAILARQGAKPEVFAAGAPIADGLVLQEVYPDHVIVLRNGVAERVDLERVLAPVTVPPPARRVPARR